MNTHLDFDFNRKFSNLGEIDMEIEKLENSLPDKRTKEYQSWKKKINFLIDTYNSQIGFKAFKKYD